MGRRTVAFARSARQLSKSSNSRRSTRGNRTPSGAIARQNIPDWSELEQAFFDAAPADEPAPAAEPERFDDLAAPVQQTADVFAALRRLIASVSAAVRRLVSRLRS
jgi:hypothetical protein